MKITCTRYSDSTKRIVEEMKEFEVTNMSDAKAVISDFHKDAKYMADLIDVKFSFSTNQEYEDLLLKKLKK